LNEFSKTFSKEELEEIEVFKEGTEAINIKISEVSKDKLLFTYAQLKV